MRHILNKKKEQLRFLLFSFDEFYTLDFERNRTRERLSERRKTGRKRVKYFNSCCQIFIKTKRKEKEELKSQILNTNFEEISELPVENLKRSYQDCTVQLDSANLINLIRTKPV